MTHVSSSSRSRHESVVASRFDLLESRFKADVPGDDFRLGAILRHLGPIGGRTVLDLGCGKGRFAARLAERGALVVGLDASGAMLRAAQGRGLPVALGSVRRLPIRSRSIDQVLLVEVLEHVAPVDLPEVLAEAFRVLRPRGRLVIVDKNAASLDPVRPWLPAVLVKRIDERRGRWMYPAGSPVRERWFLPGQIPRLLRQAGFKGIRSQAIRSPIEQRAAIFRFVPMARRFVAWSASRA
jgi:ubiquinone/menaquinone biosynthesis C-methylase UbiE